MNPTLLSHEEEMYLLKLARQTLVKYVTEKKVMEIEDLSQVSPQLQKQGSCFVTYHEDGELRGCIGSIFPTQPLYADVIEHAIDAAVHDPRFEPVMSKELSRIHIEISVLSIPQDIPSYMDFIPGEHGIILSKQGRKAVFLPQVAPEQGWDREQTLRHLSLKAGLPPNAWQSGTKFQIFTAQVFSEPKSDLT